MKPIGNCYLVEMVDENSRGRLFLPEKRDIKKQVVARILNVGLLAVDPEIQIGDIVVIERHGASTTLKHNGQNATVIPHQQILAKLEDHSFDEEAESSFFRPKTNSVPYFPIPKINLGVVTGNRVGIYPDKFVDLKDDDGILIPTYFKNSQVTRTHRGVVCRINDETRKLTGIECGMRIIYDLYSVFSLETEFHITNMENVLAVTDSGDK